tara:strand:- start:179 stop:406 length:228 start_codon:yes stop_codon:yes gene_type:complete
MVGTIFFLSPEVLRQERYTKQSDVYSYGCVLADIAMNGGLPDYYKENIKSSSAPYNRHTFLEDISEGWRPKLTQR